MLTQEDMVITRDLAKYTFECFEIIVNRNA